MTKRGGIYLLLKVVLIFGMFLLYSPPASASTEDELNQKKAQLEQQLDKYKTLSDKKSKEAQSLLNQINHLESDISTAQKKVEETQGKIGETQNTISDLSAQVDKKTKELAVQKDRLNKAIVEIYRYSSRSDIETIFAGSSLADAVNQVKYIEAVETQVKSLYEEVQKNKQELEKEKSDQEAQKAQLAQLKQDQESYKKNIEYQKNQKGDLLNMTVSQKASYEQKAQDLQKEVTRISSEIYAERQKRLSGGKEVLGGGGSGYPYSSIDEPDAWGFLTRECTSYAAWYLNAVEGKSFYNTRPGQGSAWNWPALAHDQGFTVSGNPQVGAAISWEAGGLTSAWGHVAIVEAVNSDGTIDVSEYNWIKYSYSYRKNVTPSDYGSYSYIY